MACRDSCIIKFVLGVDLGESEVVTFTICHFSSCEQGCEIVVFIGLYVKEQLI